MAKYRVKKSGYAGPERRKFLRLDFVAPLGYKVCKKKSVSMLLKGYTSNISKSGIRCNLKQQVKRNDIVWLTFDRDTLDICKDIEKNCLIYQNGIIGKVVWVAAKKGGTYNVGIRFITRKEKNLTHIYPSTRLTTGELEEDEEFAEEIEEERELEKEEDIEQIQFPGHQEEEEEYNP